MATIYGLFTEGLCWYVGSSINFKRRECEHKRYSNKGVGSDLIPTEYEWVVTILENIDDLNQRFIRERYWCETLKPFLNKRMPGRSGIESSKDRDKKYYDEHRSMQLARKKAYRDANREKLLAYAKAYRAKFKS